MWGTIIHPIGILTKVCRDKACIGVYLCCIFFGGRGGWGGCFILDTPSIFQSLLEEVGGHTVLYFGGGLHLYQESWDVLKGGVREYATSKQANDRSFLCHSFYSFLC